MNLTLTFDAYWMWKHPQELHMYINLLYIKKLSHQAVYVSEGHRLSMFKLFCTLGLFQTSFVDVFGSHPRFTKLALIWMEFPSNHCVLLSESLSIQKGLLL